jgi:hypothetical protein
MAKTGYFTTDDVATNLLYQEYKDELALWNSIPDSWLSEFCVRTTDKTVRIAQRSQNMRRTSESSAEKPPIDHSIYREITLTDPYVYELGVGFHKKAVEKGIHSEEVRTNFADALLADRECVRENIIAAMMTSGGFWDGSMTVAPPRYGQNTFLTTHTHYLAASASSTATITYIGALKRTITEHGYGRRGLLGFWNGSMATRWEYKAEPLTQYGYGTSMIDKLQLLGIPLEGTYPIDGVPWVIDEGVPDGYLVLVDPFAKPIRWRDPEGLGTGAGLIAEGTDDFFEVSELLRRWGSATTVIRPGPTSAKG